MDSGKNFRDSYPSFLATTLAKALESLRTHTSAGLMMGVKNFIPTALNELIAKEAQSLGSSEIIFAEASSHSCSSRSFLDFCIS